MGCGDEFFFFWPLRDSKESKGMDEFERGIRPPSPFQYLIDT